MRTGRADGRRASAKGGLMDACRQATSRTGGAAGARRTAGTRQAASARRAAGKGRAAGRGASGCSYRFPQLSLRIHS